MNQAERIETKQLIYTEFCHLTERPYKSPILSQAAQLSAIIEQQTGIRYEWNNAPKIKSKIIELSTKN